MRLTFSTSDYLNTSMADEHGRSLYTVSTSGFLNRQTTLYKANTSGSSNDPTTLATIKWSHCSSDKIWFEGREVEASQLMTQHGCCSSPCFVGPDNQTYKWKIGSENCWVRLNSWHRSDCAMNESSLNERAWMVSLPSTINTIWELGSRRIPRISIFLIRFSTYWITSC